MVRGTKYLGAPLDERQLVERILKGDERARTEFHQAYRQKLYSYCVYLMGANDPEIEDILQEAFLVAFQKLPQFEFRSSLDTWLTQICIHKCYRHFRKRGRTVVREADDLEALLLPRSVEANRDTEAAQDRQRKREMVQKALEKMGGNCRKILELRVKEEASYIDIGRNLKLPMGTVMSRLARCTADLKEIVKRLIEGAK